MRTFRSLIAVLGISAVVFHCTITALYHAPPSPIRQRLSGVLQTYVIPELLEQRFTMFAPEPSTASLHFLYRYENEVGDWSDWRDPGNALLAQHQANRLSYKGHLLWVHQGIARALAARAARIDAELPTFLTGAVRQAEIDRQIIQTFEYSLAQRYFSDLARRDAARAGTTSPRRVEFLYAVVPCVPFSRRHQAAIKPLVYSVKFPAAAVGW